VRRTWHHVAWLWAPVPQIRSQDPVREAPAAVVIHELSRRLNELGTAVTLAVSTRHQCLENPPREAVFQSMQPWHALRNEFRHGTSETGADAPRVVGEATVYAVVVAILVLGAVILRFGGASGVIVPRAFEVVGPF